MDTCVFPAAILFIRFALEITTAERIIGNGYGRGWCFFAIKIQINDVEFFSTFYKPSTSSLWVIFWVRVMVGKWAVIMKTKITLQLVVTNDDFIGFRWLLKC